MKIILKCDSRVQRILGKAKVKSTKYRLMNYIISQEIADGVLLLNVLSSELIWLDAKEKEIVDQLPSAYTQEMNELIEKYFLVPDDYNEYQIVMQIRRVLSHICYETGINRYVIMPTTGCNARCYYCFEKEIKSISMTDEIANNVIDFIDKQRNKNKKVYIEWFGGEPLVGHKYIDMISHGLKMRDIDFTASMITNGYLFDEQLCNKARTLWNLSRIQITLDGTKKIYNKTKSYIGNPYNPYSRVLRNIELLLEMQVYVSIRLNLSENNIDDLYILIQELNEKFGKNKEYLSVYVSPLFDESGKDRREIIEEAWKMEEYLIKKKLRKQTSKLLTLNVKACKIDSDNHISIYPDGRLLKCAVAAGEHFVGNLQDGITNEEEIKFLRKKVVREKCMECPIMPECLKPSVCTLRNTCVDYYLNHRIDICKKNMIIKWNAFNSINIGDNEIQNN